MPNPSAPLDPEFKLEQRRATRAAKPPKAAAAVACLECKAEFTPRRPHQKFCQAKCRQAWHQAGDGGLYAEISRVTLLKRGGVSMVVRFDPMDRENALSLLRGAILDVREVKGAPDA